MTERSGTIFMHDEVPAHRSATAQHWCMYVCITIAGQSTIDRDYYCPKSKVKESQHAG